MDLGTTGFWVIAAVLVAMAIATIESRRLVHYILFLFLFLVTVAALFLYLNAIFLGIAELIIYNGGIVLLLAIGISLMPEGSIQRDDRKYLVILPLATLALLSFTILSGMGTGSVGSLDYSGFSIYFFQTYGIIIAVLAFTAVVSLVTTIYFINKEDQ
ncbi:MAG: NADH-quinone oxidoreductase subunit J [Candidatus Parvarchaeota archaeon]|nr:NADH-quinone oxidoreductase subunit J [Candidatus Parvarchaeota archaeon]